MHTTVCTSRKKIILAEIMKITPDDTNPCIGVQEKAFIPYLCLGKDGYSLHFRLDNCKGCWNVVFRLFLNFFLTSSKDGLMMGNPSWEDGGKSFGGGERKLFRVFIESFATSSFCTKGEKIIVPKIPVSFGQKKFDSPVDFCQKLFKNISKGFHILISRCFSCSETSVYKCIYIFSVTKC